MALPIPSTSAWPNPLCLNANDGYGPPVPPPHVPPNVDVPPCGCTVCDSPAFMDKVLGHNASRWEGVTLRATVYVLANADGSKAVASVNDILGNIALTNAAFAPAGIRFEATVKVHRNETLFERVVLPFCRPEMIQPGSCVSLCNVSLTGYGGGFCGAIVPSANCSKVPDGVCDEACNWAEYQWDAGDCCLPMNAAAHCKDPKSPLKMWVSEKALAASVGVNGESSFNLYVSNYAECEFCGASSSLPWWYNFSRPQEQGSSFANGTIGGAHSPYGGVILTHEVGHTFGLYHVFELGVACGAPCHDGTQYPVGQQGSNITGDFCADTRPSPPNFACAEPPGVDCANQPWTHTPLHNYMGFTYASDPSCVNEFTPRQMARMRCYMEMYYRKHWEIRT